MGRAAASVASSRRRRGGWSGWVRAAIVTAGVVVLIGGGVAYARTRGTGPDYRTANVQTGSTTHALVSTGTIGPALQQTVTFPVSGTVATVEVKPGQHVTAGDVLATLVTTSQAAAVTSAQSTLANAGLTLYQAENGQIGQTGGAPAGGSTARSATVTTALVTGPGGSTPASGSSPGGSAAIVAAQKQVLASQQKIDRLLATTKADLALAGALCTVQPAAGATESAPSPSTPIPTPGPGTGLGGHGPTAPAPTTCAGALQLVLTDQTTTLAAQEGLSQQEVALDKLLARSASSNGSPKAGSGSGSKGGRTARSTTGHSSAATSSGTTTAVSGAQLAADQAAVDAARAQLLVAQQDLAQATIRTPIAGTVVAMGYTVGQRTDGSSGIQIVGSTAHVVTTEVPVTSIGTVKVGQNATVTPDGSAVQVPAKVVQVAVAPTTGTSTSYAVTLGLAGSPAGLHNGGSAAVSILTGTAVGAVVVPTSAVHYIGSFAFVTTIAGGQTTTVPVTVGVVGPAWTTVTASRGGSLPVGTQVVLADLSQALPASSTTTTPRIAFGGGVARFGGGAGAGGGAGRSRAGGG